MNVENTELKPSIGQRLKEELISYAIISLYLWMCFVAVYMYKTAILASQDVQYLPMGTALVKALIMGKFILIGSAVNVGSRVHPQKLFARIITKSILFLLMLQVFTLIEEMFVGLYHGHSWSWGIVEFINKPVLEITSLSLIMLLILVPLAAYEEIDRVLGEGRLKQLLFVSSKRS